MEFTAVRYDEFNLYLVDVRDYERWVSVCGGRRAVSGYQGLPASAQLGRMMGRSRRKMFCAGGALPSRSASVMYCAPRAE